MCSVDSAIHLLSARTLYGNYVTVIFEAYPTEMLTSRSQGLQQFRLEADLFPSRTCLTNNIIGDELLLNFGAKFQR